MKLIIVVAIIFLIVCFFKSSWGKVICGAGVLALGLVLISKITGFEFLMILAKICAVIIIVAIVSGILMALFGKKE